MSKNTTETARRGVYFPKPKNASLIMLPLDAAWNQPCICPNGRTRRFKPHEEKPKTARENERDEEFWIEVCGRPVPRTPMTASGP
jgi:hypothetical protein